MVGLRDLLECREGGDPPRLDAVKENASGVSETALHLVARKGDAPAVQLLLEHNADAELRDSSGETAADVASAGGHTEALAVLQGQVEGTLERAGRARPPPLETPIVRIVPAPPFR